MNPVRLPVLCARPRRRAVAIRGIAAASPYVICALADIDGLVAAAEIPRKTLADYRKLGLSVVQV
jgi:hypothetical protein